MAFFPANFMFHTHPTDEDHHPPSSLTPLCTPQQDFHGVASFLAKRPSSSTSMSFTGGIDVLRLDPTANINGEDEFSDDGSQAGEKKRRLNVEQVKTLEKNFELGNKLEPERKMQLARALDLQPRQIAIWFQNKRARWKTKQLEKDYEVLKRQFEAVKASNDSLQSENEKLHAEILSLKSREPTESINLNKETDQGSCSNRSDENSSDINLDISRTSAIDSPISPRASKPLFPTTTTSVRPASLAQLLQNGSRLSELPCPKIENGMQEESFCNMFNAMDDQPNFWPWSEQQQFH